MEEKKWSENYPSRQKTPIFSGKTFLILRIEARNVLTFDYRDFHRFHASKVPCLSKKHRSLRFFHEHEWMTVPVLDCVFKRVFEIFCLLGCKLLLYCLVLSLSLTHYVYMYIGSSLYQSRINFSVFILSITNYPIFTVKRISIAIICKTLNCKMMNFVKNAVIGSCTIIEWGTHLLVRANTYDGLSIEKV